MALGGVPIGIIKSKETPMAISIAMDFISKPIDCAMGNIIGIKMAADAVLLEIIVTPMPKNIIPTTSKWRHLHKVRGIP